MAQAKRAVGWLRRMGLRGRSVVLALLLGALGLAFSGCPPVVVMYGPAPEYGVQPMYGVPMAKAALAQPPAPAADARRDSEASK